MEQRKKLWVVYYNWLDKIIRMPINDNKKYQVKDYREALYMLISKTKKEDKTNNNIINSFI